MSTGANNRYKPPIWRVLAIYGVMVLVVFAIVYRLVNLQVITVSSWSGQAADNYTLTISDPAPRGIIVARRSSAAWRAIIELR